MIERCGGNGGGNYIGHICNGSAPGQMAELAWCEGLRGHCGIGPS